MESLDATYRSFLARGWTPAEALAYTLYQEGLPQRITLRQAHKLVFLRTLREAGSIGGPTDSPGTRSGKTSKAGST